MLCEFWTTLLTGLVSNLPTAFIAVVLGIPAGLWVNRHFAAWQSRGKTDRVRNVVLSDLTRKRTRLRGYATQLQTLNWGAQPTIMFQVTIPPMDDGLWRALQSSGEVDSLSPQEIALITEMYEGIIGVGVIESKMFELTTYVGPRFPGKYPDLFQALRHLIAELEKEIDAYITFIE